MKKSHVTGFLAIVGLCFPCLGHEHWVGSSAKRNGRPVFRLIPIRAPKGYFVKDAIFTRTGWIVGDIGDGLPTTNTPQGKVATRAYIWRNRHMRVLKQPDEPNAEATDASADGRVVVGTATVSWDGAWLGSSDTALVWRGGAVCELGGPQSMPDSSATRIGKDRVVYGTCREADTTDMAYQPKSAACRWAPPRYAPVVMPDQDSMAGGQDVYRHGAYASVDLVTTVAGDATPYVKVKATGARYDLNACLINAKGSRISEAVDIDGRGRIIVEMGNGDFAMLIPMKP